MKTAISRLLLALVIVCTFAVSHASAWDSIGAYTHRQLTRNAILLLPQDEYPDINRFASTLVENSANESLAHNYRYWASGGDVKGLWDKAHDEVEWSVRCNPAFFKAGQGGQI